jgi:DNA-binding transcriptional ArsR family regulator
MRPDPDLAAAASLLTEPARAAILTRLMDGRSWTAGELAKAAGVGLSTGSAHLAKLLAAGWVTVLPRGRHRYYQLAGGEIAAYLESFAGLAPSPVVRTPGERRASEALRLCRLCYDHLAGRIGVALTEALRRRGFVGDLGFQFQLTLSGSAWFVAQGLEASGGPARACMDWSERRLHLAGPLGRALARGLLERDWLQRDPKSRALWVTPRGREGLRRDWQVEVEGVAAGGDGPVAETPWWSGMIGA